MKANETLCLLEAYREMTTPDGTESHPMKIVTNR
jgi:hypothetical protein